MFIGVILSIELAAPVPMFSRTARKTRGGKEGIDWDQDVVGRLSVSYWQNNGLSNFFIPFTVRFMEWELKLMVDIG